MSGLDALNRPRAKKGDAENRVRTPNERVSFKVVGFHTENEDGTPSPNDYMEVVLTRPALGIVPTRDADGKPGPVVKLKYRPNPHASAPSVAKFRDGGGSIKKMSGKTAVGLAENCYYKASENTIYTKWLLSFMPSVNKMNARAIVGQMIQAQPERAGKGERKGSFMYNSVAITDSAKVVTGLDDFRATAAKLMSEAVEADFPGQRGFILRAHHSVDGEVKNASIEAVAAWNNEAKVYAEPAATVEAFLTRVANNEELKGWIPLIEQAGSGQMTLEVIPTLRYKIGAMSLTSAKIDNAIREAKKREPDKVPSFSDDFIDGKDDSLVYQGFEFPDDAYPMSMYVRSDMRVMRNETTPEVEEGEPAPERTWSNWFVTGTWQNSHKPALFSARELITPNLSAEAVTAFTAKAEGRETLAEIRRKQRAAAKQAADAPAPEQVPAPKPEQVQLPVGSVPADAEDMDADEDQSMEYGFQSGGLG